MKQTEEQLRDTLLILFGTVLFAIFVSPTQKTITVTLQPALWSLQVGAPAAYARFPEERVPDRLEYRIAKRLQTRLRKWHSWAPSIHDIATAIRQRQSLLRNGIQVIFQTKDNPEFLTWDVSLQRYPLWIKPEFSTHSAGFRLSAKNILSYLGEQKVEGIPYPEDTHITSLRAADSGLYVETEGTAKEGLTFPVSVTVDKIYRALRNGTGSVMVTLDREPGALINDTDVDLGELTLLASGRSDFAGSIPNRIKNIHKGLDEHLQNVIVAPGESFSFNGAMEPPINTANGWYMAYVIFNGDELRWAPGGGICQVSTTLYRALVNAGLPVEERRAHSMFINYYEKYGVGIDATIFPGQVDLVFRNDTSGYLIIQAYNDGNEAIVNIYGTPDGRSVELEGPYFADNAPKGFRYKGRALWKNEIAWIQRIRSADGQEQENIIFSRYKKMPENIAGKYGQKVETVSFAGQERD